MGSVSEIGVQVKKMLIISIRACHRSVRNHPFLVCLLGFLIFLYRSFPFVFSILVSASPVLVCTAVLLGTLLSFGQPNIPDVEKEEEVTHGISSFQTEFSEVTTFIAEKDESLVVKTHTENTGVVEERSTEEASLVGDKGRDVEEGDNLTSYMPLIDEAEASQDFQNEKQVIEQADREFCCFELEKKSDVQEQKLKAEVVSSDDEAIEKQYVFVQKVDDEILDIDNEETAQEPLQTFNGDHLDFSPSSSWKQVENNEEQDSFDSESDRAESSSPDASMADIMPMLDELHPLLDLEGSRPAHLSRDGSTASEKSQKSNDGSIESDEDTENQVEVEEDGVDEHDDEEEEGGKEDESKAAIKWTEDDQKNLMDLGTSELERNLRLENLIARRRARRMMTEKNLIDLESSDLPFNVAPITTTRRNPFDFLDDSYVAMGLPPIPGSAPSVLQPRRNPFDIPYDPNEEKPDLKGDSFEQEFMVFNQKDTLFRRHESFSLRPSGLGTIKHGRQDMSWKPVFVSEQMASEGTSYAPFQRQLSEVSETMLSSVQDTESLSSTDQDERKFNEQDFSQETELISDVSHASLCVERGSQSPGEVDSMEMIQVEESNAHHDEAEIVLGGVENLSEAELYSETRAVTVHEEFNIGDSEAHLGSEPVDEESNSQSSGSLLSEVIDSIPNEKGGISTSMQSGDNHLRDSRASSQDFVEEVDFHNLSGGVEDNQHGEPLYDSSPLPAEKFASFSSVSSDSAAEISERSLPPAPEETIANLTYKNDHILEVNGSGYEENHSEISQLHIEVKNELNSGDSRDINQHDFNVAELAAVPKRLLGHDGTSAHESEVMQPVYVDSSLSSDVGAIKAKTSTVFVHEQEQADYLHAESEFIKDNSGDPSSDYHIASVKSEPLDQEFVEEGAEHYGVDSSKPDDEIVSEVVQEVDEKLDLVASYSEHAPSSDSLMSKPMVNPDLPSEETESVEEGSVHYGMDSSRLDENMSEVVQDADEKPDLVTSYSRCMPSSDSLISAPQDSEPLLVAEQAPVVDLNLPSEETEHGEKVLSNEIDMLEVQQNSVFSSNSFEPGETELHQDKEVPSSSDCQYLQFEVKSPSVLEDDLSSLDKSVVSPPFCEHDETQKSNIVQAESTLATDEVPLKISSIASDSSESPELVKSPTDQVDLEADRLGEVANEVLEPLDSSAEGYGSQVTEENIKESDGVKEIDEELLLELDTVGDFSIGDAGVSLRPELSPEETTVRVAQYSLPKDTAEFEQEIPILEARSLEDIDLAFEQLKEGVDVEEFILPSTIKDLLSSDKSEDHLEASSDLQFVEARTLDDTDTAVETVSEVNQGELPKVLDLKDESIEVEANDVGSVKIIEFCGVESGNEEVSQPRTSVVETENAPTSRSSNEIKSHSRRSSSSSSSSDSD